VFGAVLTFTAPQVLPGGSVQCEYNVSFTTPGVRNVVARLVSSGTFDPDGQNDTATSVLDVNRDTLISLDGRVTTPPGNPALAGVTVTLNGPVVRTSTLDPAGRFDFRNVPAGSYTISASAPSWVFSPGYQLLNQVESRGDLNFSARAVFSVSGRATDRRGTPLSDIYLYLSGSGTGQRVTGADGRYEFGPLDYTGTYTITASSNDSGATFEPRSPQFTALVGPQTRDFVLVPNRQSFIVNTTDDVGDGVCDAAHCSLRDALTETAANGSGYDVITFAIPGSGVRTITLTQLLPTALGVDINGYTQPGSRQATNATGAIDAVPLIEINGNGLPVALTLEDSRAIGLIVNRAETLIATTAYGEVRGCFLGTTADGLASAGGNQRTAIRADRMIEMVVGTLNPGWRNVIAGDGGPDDIGIDVSVQETTSIGGNLIGLAKDGVTVLGHGAAGIRYRDAQPGTAAMVSIGGDGALGNVIGGATAPNGAGIVIAACPGPCPVEDVVTIGDNLIGLTADERLPAANTYGIRVEDQSGATVKVGVGDFVDPNVIRFNTKAGILIAPPTSATSSAVEVGPNRISDNGGLGIDLDGDGPTANDPGDIDVGRQNWPRVTRVTRTATTTTIEGTASGMAGSTLRLQFFANTTGDPSGYGEGDRWIGSHTVSLDGSGVAPFAVTLPVSLSSSEEVSAIAVGASVSEFSRAEVRLIATATPPTSGFTYVPVRYPVRLTLDARSPSAATDAFIDFAVPPDGRVSASCASPLVVATTPRPGGVRLVASRLEIGAAMVCDIFIVFTTPGFRLATVTMRSATPQVAAIPAYQSPLDIAETRVSLGGRITERGGPPSVPVTVLLGGPTNSFTSTAPDGTYSFANVPAGSYTVTAQALGRVFAPASRVLVDQAASRSDLDFAMSAPLSITGRITERVGGAPVAGVTVSLTGDRIASTTSDATGAYAFPALAAGTYTVTVTQDGRRFDPPSRTLAAITADTAADFQRLPLFTISGTVTDLNGSPVPGVTIGISGGRSDVATTDANGAYAFSGLPSTNFTVTPARTGFTFSPIPRSIVLLESNEDVSFVAQSGAFARYLAEGATGALFDTQIALFNATGTPTTATLTFQKPDGTTQVQTVPLGGLERRTVVPESLPGLEDTAFSTVVTSDQPIAIDRTMTWDDSRYGSHAETGIVQPLTRWFLAEGATTAGFDLFYLIQNPNTTAASVTVRYLLATGAPLEKTYTVPPTSRFNIWVNLEDDRLAAAEMSADITSDVPVIVERAMYRTVGTQVFGMGHEGAGVPQQATEWFFAEGATGSFFDLFFLIANPTGDAAQVEATYLKPDGSTVVKTYTVAPNSRFNIWVDHEDPALADTAVGTTFRVTNGVGVVVERAMWWAGDSTQWREGHNTAGATQTGEKWALAEGEVTGAPFFTDTFILVANTGTSSGTVRVTLVFEDGTAPVSKDFAMPGSARLNVMASADFPVAVGKRFGTVVESVGATPLPLVVERAMYNRSQGVDFAAGTAALGARLR
jgi:CSLREA domain-containing protein